MRMHHIRLNWSSTEFCPLIDVKIMLQLNVWQQMRFATNCTYFVCHISTELRPWSQADCSIKFESIRHLYGTAETCATTKISTVAGICNVRNAFIYACCNFWTVRARVLNFHIWIPYGKIADPYFFLVRVMPLSRVMPLLKMRWRSY